MCVFLKLRVKRQVSNMQGALKEGSLVIARHSFSLPTEGRFTTKAYPEVKLVSSTLRLCSLLTFFKKYKQFCCTALLRRRKLVYLDSKSLVCFTQNLVQIFMILVEISKSNRRIQKMAKTGIVRKNPNMRLLEAKC